MQNQSVSPAPVSQSERITLLDSLRGIAILGILLMNIPGFGLAEVAYGDPAAAGEMGTINFKTWFAIDWFMEGTQRALFSMLFGAGMILFVSRLEKKLEGTWPADYYIRRQLWLLVFGLFNAYVLLWFWDILFHYAIAGVVVFAFRRMPAKGLLVAALVSLVLQTTRDNVELYRSKRVIAKGEAIAKIDTMTVKLSDGQKQQLGAMTEFRDKSKLEKRQEAIKESLRKMRGDYNTVYEYQSQRSFQTHVFYGYYGLFDVLMFMFLGMALFKLGIFTGQASVKLYAWLFGIGIGVGLLLSWYRLQPYIETQFNEFEYTKNVGFTFYEISRSFRSVGLFGLIMLMYKSGWFGWFFDMLRPVGQMAFTNYLAQSFLVGLYFYGIGFGKFGMLERHQIYYVVGVVWLMQIIWSHIWLRYFRFGPLEWAWRSLTYWKKQPLKIGSTKTDSFGMV